jgi:general secretion pathway protein A
LHRIAVAGGSDELFTRAAVELVHECTGGVPRLVNIVCDTALVYGFADKLDSIGVEIVEQVVQDRMSGGLLPLRATAPAVHTTLAAG